MNSNNCLSINNDFTYWITLLKSLSSKYKISNEQSNIAKMCISSNSKLSLETFIIDMKKKITPLEIFLNTLLDQIENMVIININK